MSPTAPDDCAELLDQLVIGTALIDEVGREFLGDGARRSFTSAELVTASIGAALVAASILHNHPDLVDEVGRIVRSFELGVFTSALEVAAGELVAGDRIVVDDTPLTVLDVRPSYFDEVVVRVEERSEVLRVPRTRTVPVVARPPFPGPRTAT